MTADPPSTTTDAARWGARAAAPRAVAAAATLLAATVALILTARVLGPSQLFQNTDETKTVAFTADAAFEGAWILPRDSTGYPTLKPPLVNWIGAPFVATGWHSELAYKVPSILAALAAAGVAIAMSRRLYPRLAEAGNHPDDPDVAAGAGTLALAAAACLLASTGLVKHVYFLRPDMLMAAVLAVGWWSATVCLERRDDRRSWRWAMAMWLAAAAAGLTKGPYALLIPAYALAAAPFLHRSWRAFNATRWWWGVPLMVVPALLWLWLAWRVDPEHVAGPLLGGELLERMPGQGEQAVRFKPLIAVYNVPLLAIERFAPWGVFAIIAMIFVPPWRWRTHAVAPAILWVLVVYAALIATAGRAGSYILMATPALAVLAAYALARIAANVRWHGVHIAAAAVLAAAAISARESFLSRGARTGLGDEIAAFARAAEDLVGDDPVAFVGTGYNPVANLMGRARHGEPTADALAAAVWIVQPADAPPPAPGAEPALTSGALTRLRSEGAEVHSESPGLALFGPR
jgi:4-amino-4-deoxy-L-arabinose transferase-like glycosyltransferase